MAVEDDYSVSALLSESRGLEEKPDELSSDGATTLLSRPRESIQSEKPEEISPEDAAWADSCFAVDPANMSDDSWGALREALLETLAVHATFQQETSPTGYSDDILGDHHQQHVEDSGDEEMMVASDEEEEEEHTAIPEKRAEPMLLVMIRDGDANNTQGSSSSGLQEEDPEESRESIFPVWELLETPDEEDELIKQLSKILTETKNPTASPASDETITTPSEGSLDELVASMGDLSLKPFSG